MECNKRDPLDNIIDDALRCYSQSEPLAGLEERILNRTRRLGEARGVSYLRVGAFVGMALLLGLCAFILFRPTWRPPPTFSMVAVRSYPPLEQPPLSRLRRIAISTHRHARRILPKAKQFPIPQPLTAEERALLCFVDRNPKEAAETFASLRANSEPINIQPLEIPPLQADNVSN